MKRQDRCFPQLLSVDDEGWPPGGVNGYPGLQAGFMLLEIIERVEANLEVEGTPPYKPDSPVKLNVEGAVSQGVSEADACFFLDVTERLNELTRNGMLELDPSKGWRKINPRGGGFFDGRFSTTIGTMNMEMEVRNKWWGTQFWLSKDLVKKIREALDAGAAISALAALLTKWLPISAATALIIAGALKATELVLAFMDFCNGVNVNVITISPKTVITVTPA